MLFIDICFTAICLLTLYNEARYPVKWRHNKERKMTTPVTYFVATANVFVREDIDRIIPHCDEHISEKANRVVEPMTAQGKARTYTTSLCKLKEPMSSFALKHIHMPASVVTVLSEEEYEELKKGF